MSVQSIVEECRKRNGWSDEKVIEILCEILCDYIDNQQSDAVLEDRLYHEEEEEG